MKVVESIGVVAALCGAVGVIFAVWRKLFKNIFSGIRRVHDFLEDWNGRPGDELRGVPPQEGMMQRVSNLEKRSESTQREVQFNGGSVTLADVVKRIDVTTKVNTAGITHLAERADTNQHKIERMNEKLYAHSKLSEEYLNKTLVELAKKANMEIPPPKLVVEIVDETRNGKRNE